MFFPLYAYADSKRDFCVGFEEGYVVAHKENTKSNIKPIIPVCPIPTINKNNLSYSQYGFITGYNKNKKETR
jgi:hypothetical protein